MLLQGSVMDCVCSGRWGERWQILWYEWYSLLNFKKWRVVRSMWLCAFRLSDGYIWKIKWMYWASSILVKNINENQRLSLESRSHVSTSCWYRQNQSFPQRFCLMGETDLQGRMPAMPMTTEHIQAFAGFCLNSNCKHLILFVVTECSQNTQMNNECVDVVLG